MSINIANIRKIQLSDYDDIYNLWMSCPGMGFHSQDDSFEGFSKLVKRNPDTCLLYEENGQILGTILVGCDGRRGYIYHTCVSEKRRGEGIGSTLVDTVLEILKKEGITKVGLFVFKTNDSGNLFWEKRGAVKRDNIYYRNFVLEEQNDINT